MVGSRLLKRFVVATLPAAIVFLAPSAGAATAPPCTGSHWVGSWSAAPSDGGTSRPLLADQTLRMIIAPHLGGSLLRIHLSNRFGSSPTTLGPVTIALEDGGPSVAPGSLRQVRFDGAETVTIPAGADTVSDPVPLAFGAFQDLAISVAIPEAVGSPTEHFFTRQTSYLTPVGAGDHAADTSGSAFTQTTASDGYSNGWYFIDGVDVQATGATQAVAAFGDSVTDGFQGQLVPVREDLSTIDTNTRWPDYLQRRVIAAGLPLSVLNTAIDGNRILKDGFLPPFGPSGISRFRADALAQAGVTDVIVLEGINDIGMTYPGGITAQDLIAGYTNLIDQAHHADIKMQLGTITPAGGTLILTYGSPQADQLRQQVNQWIRTQTLSDGVVDFDAAVRDASDPSRVNPAYDSSDHLHLNAAGYQAMANTVDLRQLAQPCPDQRLTLFVQPRAVVAGTPTFIRFHVVTPRNRAAARRRVRIIVAGRQFTTAFDGTALARLIFRHAGRIHVTAIQRGFLPARAVIHVVVGRER